jgi:anti-sigma regulatory factor (Ser/Thr protein kinase)
MRDVSNLAVSGDYPAAAEARRDLRDARFQRFIAGLPALSLPQPEILALEDGTLPGYTLVQGEIALKISTFLTSRHAGLSREESDTIGTAAMECLENVRVHAYSSRNARRKGWLIVGLHDQATSTSSLAILDLGVGVVATIEDRLGVLAKVFSNRADYLEEAVTGKVTETGLKHRGQGFRILRTFVQGAPGRELHVLSSGAMVTFSSQGVVKRLTEEFRGTIVCLQIRNHPLTTVVT